MCVFWGGSGTCAFVCYSVLGCVIHSSLVVCFFMMFFPAFTIVTGVRVKTIYGTIYLRMAATYLKMLAYKVDRG